MNVNFDVCPNMDMKDNTVGVFFALLRAGLWEGTDVNLNDNVNWDEVYQLAGEQSVIGVVLAGIEHSKVKPPQELLLQWIGEVLMVEQQNKSMNGFVADLMGKLRSAGIYALLVKGQGVAQCYKRPLWRLCGDIDLILSAENYDKAKALLIPLADDVQSEEVWKKHQALIIKGFNVELHGKMPFGLLRKADKLLDAVIEDSLTRGGARVWTYNNSDIYLPNAYNDVIVIFTHFLRHFFLGGVGLRQICDWCRLLWTYRYSQNKALLESRIRKMGLLSEWKTFASFAVDMLGMPEEAMPFYSDEKKWSRKAEKIRAFIIEVGNFGRNRDSSYYGYKSKLFRKVVQFSIRCRDIFRHARIFPLDSLRFFPQMVYKGLKAVAQGG